jgi:hypothetical protein
LAWLATLFPTEVAFVGLGGGLFDTPEYAQQLREVLGRRPGPVYTIVEGHHNWRADNVSAANAVIDAIGLTASEGSCRVLRSVVLGLGLRADVAPDATKKCRLELQPRDYRDIAAENRKATERVADAYAAHGLRLHPEDCVPFFAYVGRKKKAYQWCQVASP